jgi:hypothetical protein
MSNNRLLALIGAVGVLATRWTCRRRRRRGPAAAGRTTAGLGDDSALVAGSSPVLTAAHTPIGEGDATALSLLVVLGLVPGGRVRTSSSPLPVPIAMWSAARTTPPWALPAARRCAWSARTSCRP